MPKQTPISKITRPRLPSIYARTRLFRMLDGQRNVPITWVSGPAGSGKTTLIASYLDARKMPCLWYQLDEGDSDIASFFYYMGLAAKKASPRITRPLPLLTAEYLSAVPTFTRRYFENLYSRLKPPYVLVLDNYQDVPEESAFHEVIMHGLAIIPHGIHVIVISRGALSVSLADLRAKNSMGSIEWEELRFTADESYALLRLHCKKIVKDSLKEICERAQGWAAGLVLMADGVKTASDMMQPHGEFSREKIFDYFAGEIVNRLDSDARNFLFMTSFLPNMTVHNARKLTGDERAGQILSHLSRNNFFTEKHGVSAPLFRYHPLFREFLQARMKESLSQEDVVRVQRRAAELLEESGQTEDAAGLFIESGDWQSLIGLILKHAPQLMAQGRSGPLDAWLASIPNEIVDGMPWLLYWKGMCRFAMNPAESLTYLKKAFQHFRTQRDISGAFLAWAGIVDSVLYCFEDMNRLDEWIESYHSLRQEDEALPPPEIASLAASSMFMALVFRQPWRTDLDNWLDKALAYSNDNVKVQALFYYVYHLGNVGGLAKAWQAIDTLHRLGDSREASPFNCLTIHVIEIAYYNVIGQYSLSRTAAIEGLKLADKSGVHILDFMILGNGILSAYNYGDHATAAEFFANLPPDPMSLRPWDRSFYYYLQALKSFLHKDMQQAFVLNEQALRIALKFGDPNSPFLCVILHAHIMHERGECGKAKEFLDRMIEPWRREGRSHDAFLYYLTKAHLYLDDADQTTAIDSLNKALSIGKEEQCVSTYVTWHPAAIGRLYRTALEHGIEVEYVKDVIRKRNFVPEEPPLHIEQWPWPLKIHTLGEFNLLRDDNPVRYSRKAPKKPLELLRVIIALGGRDLSEHRLMDVLWPEAEGDSGHKALSVTLARLRELLGVKDALQVSEGMISLDDRYVWTDVRAFELVLERSKAAEREGKKDEAALLLEKAVGMYQGHFLAGESGSWAISPRERLRESFLHAIESLGAHWERKQEWQKAIEVYCKGVAADDLIEKCYIGMMACLHKLGSSAEALSVYRRLKKTLNGYGVEPSAEAVALRDKITGRR